MQISLVGLLVCISLAALGYFMRGMLIIGLLASLAFGSTAVVTLSTLGGSSPLIYTCFAALLIVAAAMRRHIARELGGVFGRIPVNWIVCGLMAYAVAGAVLFPRLFAGRASVFVASAERQGIVESTLAPVSGNITQSGYFVLGGLTAIAMCVMLLGRNRLDQVRRGFFLWCVLHAGMGLIDISGKFVGMSNILAPIRTANYAMLADVGIAGFWRIAGAYSEASAFGTASLNCIAFSYVYWRKTKRRPALYLTLVLLALVLLSTSSTAYVGLAVLCVAMLVPVGRSALSNRLERDEIRIVIAALALVFATMAVSLYNEGIFDPIVRLVDSTVISKGRSGSGQERAYWNIRSIQAFADTVGFGVGLGSSRASSWPVAVLSQFGLIGSVMLGLLVAVVVSGLGRYSAYADRESVAVVAAVRASALAGLVGGSLVSGTADPGIGFFMALAVVAATRADLCKLARESRHHAHLPQSGPAGNDSGRTRGA